MAPDRPGITGSPRIGDGGPSHGHAPMPVRFAAGLLISLFVVSCGLPRPPQIAPGSASVPSAPSAVSEGFQAALPGYRFRFPADAGAHPAYKTEWWYYTGHLRSAGHEYGFELTFFRVGLTAHPRP
ncbi:MAG: carotenoid 1,2-hydratase, partial [Chloroflexi bacterium]|nr:carotenoid 1,2-hydratase [Chloroflexota bacterium]